MKKRAFTLVELLVVISIIALLLSIMMPSLRAARERAKRIVCSSNLKSIGIGIFVYSQSNNERIPATDYRTGGYDTVTGELDVDKYCQPYITYKAFEISRLLPYGEHIVETYGFGYLWSANVIQAPEVFYCPSVPDTLMPPYAYKYYHDSSHPWPWNSDPSRYNAHFVRAGYTYVPQNGYAQYAAYGSSDTFPQIATKASQLKATLTMCTDMLFDLEHLSHRQSGKTRGVNVLLSDNSANFVYDSKAFDSAYWIDSRGMSFEEDEWRFRKVIQYLGTGF